MINSKPIYTLDYLKTEAEGISGHWNGEDDNYIDHNGDARKEYDATIAGDLLEKIKEVEALIEELGI